MVDFKVYVMNFTPWFTYHIKSPYFSGLGGEIPSTIRFSRFITARMSEVDDHFREPNRPGKSFEGRIRPKAPSTYPLPMIVHKPCGRVKSGPDVGSAHRPVLAELTWVGTSDDPSH